MELSIKHDLTLHISLSFNIAGRTKRLCINLFMESDRCYKYICCELVSSGVWFLLMFHLIKLLLYWQIGGTSCFIWKNPTFFNFTSVCSCIVHFCEVEVFYDEIKMLFSIYNIVTQQTRRNKTREVIEAYQGLNALSWMVNSTSDVVFFTIHALSPAFSGTFLVFCYSYVTWCCAIPE